MSALPTRAPQRTLETCPFWDGCAEGRLVLPRCRSCSTLIWYPRRFCPSCASTDVAWEAVSGRGAIYSFTVMRNGTGAYRSAAPYVLAYVELDEGPRMLTNIVGVDPESVAIGQAVQVTFDPVADSDDALPRFRPA